MLWGALRSCYGAESEAVAAAARNTGTILPYLNSPSNIKGCYAVLVELLGSEQATEVCAKNPGILQCNPRVLAPERAPKSGSPEAGAPQAAPLALWRRPRRWRRRPVAPGRALRAARCLPRPLCRGGPPRQWEEAAAAPGHPPRPHARRGAAEPPPSFPGAGAARRAAARRRDGACPCRNDVAGLRAAGCGGPPGPALGG